MKEKDPSKVGGIHANALVIPLGIVISLLLLFIIILVFEVNRSTNNLSDMLQRCSDEQQYATNLQAGCSILSETATSFAQAPVDGEGTFNTGPLLRYAQEFGTDRRGSQIAEWFTAQGASSEVQACIDNAVDSAKQMLDVQLHVISLLRSVYTSPPVPDLEVIPEVPLTEEELAMAEEARAGYAKSLILSRDYSLLKSSVAENIEECHKLVQQEYGRSAAECQRHINILRTALWVVIISIIVIMIATFVLFYRWLIRPLRRYARQITSDQPMDQVSRIREMRVLAGAYNALLRRHDRLENILRSAAETDALTELPNRYSLEHNVLETGDKGGSMAVLLFDVNYLKVTNDTRGHLEGDKLLQTTGACIRECFGVEGGGNCYRIGGDEFAAVLRDCTEEEVKNRIEHFSLVLEREDISVSVGYAYTEKTDEDSFRRLMNIADKKMYEQKKETHRQHHPTQQD